MNKTLHEEATALHAEICAGLADPTRITILYILADGPKTVSEIAQAVETSQPLISRHLKVLRDRGMVSTQRRGVSVEYRLKDVRLIEALDLLRGVLRDHLSNRAELVEQMG